MKQQYKNIIILVIVLSIIVAIVVLSITRVKSLRRERDAKRNKTQTSESSTSDSVEDSNVVEATVNRPNKTDIWVEPYRDVYTNSQDEIVHNVIDDLVDEKVDLRYAEVVYAEEIANMDVVPEIVENTDNIAWYLEMSTGDAKILTYVVTTNGEVIKDY